MSTQSQALSEPRQADNQLRKGSLGVPGIVFFVVAAAAPLGAVTGGGAFTFIMGGPGAPALYIGGAIMYLFFAVGLATMSRYVVNAGGFAAFAAQGLGRRAGQAMGGVAPLAYLAVLFGVYGQLGAFGADMVESFFGVSVPWQVFVIVTVAVVALLGYLDIDVSAKVLGLFMILEVVILLLFDFVLIAKGGGPDGYGLGVDGFKPSNVFNTGMAVPLLFALSCFNGFEQTTLYGEEAKDPKKTVARATYAAIAIMAIFYGLTMWAIGAAYGPENVQDAAAADPVNFVFGMNTKIVGKWSTDIMQVLVLTSLFAVTLSLHNGLGRYLFSLGRAGFYPKMFGRTHHKFKSPHYASITLSILTFAVLAVFMIAGADPMVVVFALPMAVGTLALLVLQCTGAFSVVGYFLRTRADRNIWKTFISPLIGGLMLLGAIILAVFNFDQLTGAGPTVTRLLPWFVPAAIVFGIGLGIFRQRQGVDIDLGKPPEEYEKEAVEGRSLPQEPVGVPSK